MKKCASCDHAPKRPLCSECLNCIDKSNWKGEEVHYCLQLVTAGGASPKFVMFGKFGELTTNEEEILYIDNPQEALKKARSLDCDPCFRGTFGWQVICEIKE